MSGWDRALPPSDRAEEPDPLPRETALERVQRICPEHGWMVPPSLSVAKRHAAQRGDGFKRIDDIMAGRDPNEPGAEG